MHNTKTSLLKKNTILLYCKKPFKYTAIFHFIGSLILLAQLRFLFRNIRICYYILGYDVHVKEPMVPLLYAGDIVFIASVKKIMKKSLFLAFHRVFDFYSAICGMFTFHHSKLGLGLVGLRRGHGHPKKIFSQLQTFPEEVRPCLTKYWKINSS